MDINDPTQGTLDVESSEMISDWQLHVKRMSEKAEQNQTDKSRDMLKEMGIDTDNEELMLDVAGALLKDIIDKVIKDLKDND